LAEGVEVPSGQGVQAGALAAAEKVPCGHAAQAGAPAAAKEPAAHARHEGGAPPAQAHEPSAGERVSVPGVPTAPAAQEKA